MAIGSMVDGAVRATVATLPTERLEAEITELAGHLTAAQCRFVLLVAEFDRREAWLGWECRSCAHWLAWQCGIELRAAREKVRVGRALAELPVICAAFARGELSYSKVRALTRVANPITEVDLVSIALGATATHVERLVRSWPGACPRTQARGPSAPRTSTAKGVPRNTFCRSRALTRTRSSRWCTRR